MISIKKEGVVLRPSGEAFEKRSVLNPAVYQDGESLHLVYRAIAEDYMSCLGYARLKGPLETAERWTKPFLFPSRKEESRGIEDPRLVRIENTFYMTYVVHDGKHAITAYSEGEDLFKMKRKGVISPKIPYKDLGKILSYGQVKDEYYLFESFYKEYGGNSVYIWHKDLVPFPEKVGGRFLFLERILPDIQIVRADDPNQLKDKYFWLNHLFNLRDSVVLEPEHGFESRHLGAGAPPIKTDEGWLLIYHACQEMNKGRKYSAGAALLDSEDPGKVIARLPYPLFEPAEDYEMSGTVNNVVFPTGTAVFDGRLYIYYGAADHLIAAASVGLNELIAELLDHKTDRHG